MKEALMKKFRNMLAEVREIPTEKIEIKEWVRMKCMYGCSFYGKSRSCPPYTPEIETCRKIISEYNRALILKFRTNERKILEKLMLDIERFLFLSGYYKAFAFFVSPCSACGVCTPEKCKQPERARPTAEAFGIDLIGTAKKSGMKMDVFNSSKIFLPIGIVLVE